jgi:phosphoglycerate dehydrogenase-like enzyme
MTPLIWIIDEEWSDYNLETELLKAAFPDADIRRSTYDYKNDLAAFGKDADAILAQVYAPLPAAAINALTKCKIIAVYGSGYEMVDVRAASSKGIAVTNVPGYCAEDIADYILAAIFHCYKRLDFFASAGKSGAWDVQAVDRVPERISAQTLHIIGLGLIGRTVAKKALFLGMKLTAFDPNMDAPSMQALGIKKVAWDEGLAGADYVSVHTVLTAETTGLVKYEDFLRMKKTAHIFNASRGKVLDEEGLIRAVKEGLIRGAVLDVVSEEPPKVSAPILATEGILVTPHISYISRQSYDELKRRAAGNVITYLSGGSSKDCVN